MTDESLIVIRNMLKNKKIKPNFKVFEDKNYIFDQKDYNEKLDQMIHDEEKTNSSDENDCVSGNDFKKKLNFKIIGKSNSGASFFQFDNYAYGCLFELDTIKTEYSKKILQNLFIEHFNMENWFIENQKINIVNNFTNKVRNDLTFVALSGGINSFIATKILEKNLSSTDNINCILIDNGLIREDEIEIIDNELKNVAFFKDECSEDFYNALQNINDFQEKKKIISDLLMEKILINISV